MNAGYSSFAANSALWVDSLEMGFLIIVFQLKDVLERLKKMLEKEISHNPLR